MLVNCESPDSTDLLGNYIESRTYKAQNFLWNDEEIKSHIAKTPSGWVGLKKSEQMVSLILFTTSSDVIEINYLETISEFKRKGYMRELLGQLLGKYSHCEFWLDVHEANRAALKLYEKLGFATSGRREKYYKDGGTALLMCHKPIES